MSYQCSAKWPVLLDRFIESGMPAMMIDADNKKRAAYIVKALNQRYNAKERDVLVISRKNAVYLINDNTVNRCNILGED